MNFMNTNLEIKNKILILVYKIILIYRGIIKNLSII